MQRVSFAQEESIVGDVSLCDVLHSRANEAGDLVGYRFLPHDTAEREATLSYAELDRRARSIAEWLTARDVANRPVALAFPAGLDFVAAFFGVLYAGAIGVPLSIGGARAWRQRLSGAIADAGAPVVLTVSAIMPRLRKALGGPLEHVELGAVDLMSTGPGNANSCLTTKSEIALLQYTSGSTAAPKGVRIRHSNLVSNARIIARSASLDSSSIGVSWLPHFHDMGLVGAIVTPLCVGFPVTLMAPGSFLTRPARWLEAISRFKATVSGSPNFGYELCVDAIDAGQLENIDLSSWSTAFAGAEPIRRETLERFTSRFGPNGFGRDTFFPCYGLAEATLLVAGGRWRRANPHRFSRRSLREGKAEIAAAGEEDAVELVSSGCASDGCDVRIVDPDIRTCLSATQVGEIWVAGNCVGDGYWNQPVESTETFCASIAGGSKSQFLRTGDLGFFHEEQLFVVGRSKDLLIINGENYYPQDIEHTLERHVAGLRVGSGAVFSIEHDREEKLVVVFEVESDTEEAGYGALIEGIYEVAARHHGVNAHAILLADRNAIPRTTSGKVQRHACKTLFLSGKLGVLAERASPARGSGSALGPQAREAIGGSSSVSDWEDLVITEVSRLLEIPKSSIHPSDSIQALGMDSLLTARLINRIESQLIVLPEVHELIEASTIAAVAACLARKQSQDGMHRGSKAWLERQVERLSDDEVARLLEDEKRAAFLETKS